MPSTERQARIAQQVRGVENPQQHLEGENCSFEVDDAGLEFLRETRSPLDAEYQELEARRRAKGTPMKPLPQAAT